MFLINLSKNQINEISLNSLENRKIKEIELKERVNLNDNNIEKLFINNFISEIGYKNEQDLIIRLNQINLDYKFFKNNIKIDNLWRDFILNKFKSQIKVDADILKKQIQNSNTEIEELNLSEILFQLNGIETLESIKKNIFLEIENSGFDVAASIYSISDSNNYGGKLGWIKSNLLSKEIYDQIKNAKEITNPIKTNNGYLILKINDRRLVKEEINFDEEFKKLYNAEVQKELNKLGYIYFNKIKKRLFISES